MSNLKAECLDGLGEALTVQTLWLQSQET